ncbi:MAG: dUTP diphosphatase [Bacteroidia bacterium]|nr:dUTP diphosphatase [Bacteroidia bacterium]MCO5254458.1 dUTP diphosphatase [Bacteroidota bacterium]MCZ2130010.1 dUTP diphosphatase [Bacteroidia bacterium]
MTKINVINKSGNPLPAYQTTGSAGMDLMAFLEKDIEIASGKTALIPTGLFFELPQDMEAQIRPRSGLAFKHGITVLNSPGTIDSDYRGEIKVLLINHSDTPFTIQNGERIAQVIFAKVTQISWVETQNISQTERGAGGYGHTGK